VLDGESEEAVLGDDEHHPLTLDGLAEPHAGHALMAREGRFVFELDGQRPAVTVVALAFRTFLTDEQRKQLGARLDVVWLHRTVVLVEVTVTEAIPEPSALVHDISYCSWLAHLNLSILQNKNQDAPSQKISKGL